MPNFLDKHRNRRPGDPFPVVEPLVEVAAAEVAEPIPEYDVPQPVSDRSLAPDHGCSPCQVDDDRGHGPCLGCLFWEDGYGGRHCWECEAPPRPSLVKQAMFVVDVVGDCKPVAGGHYWEEVGIDAPGRKTSD